MQHSSQKTKCLSLSNECKNISTGLKVQVTSPSTDPKLEPGAQVI